MKFTLTYDGPLPSTGNGSKKVAQKWAIRSYLNPQLVDLWMTHPALRDVYGAWFPKGGGMLVQSHHTDQDPITLRPLTLMQSGQPAVLGAATRDTDKQIPLAPPIAKAGRWFLPIVRDSLGLTCALDILFLRQEPPGKVYQGGDLDNRIKTLLDALSVPQDPAQVVNDGGAGVVHCLVENDALVTAMNVRSERLLGLPNAPKNEVRLVIGVDVRVANSRIYNQSFLGD